MHRHPAVHPRQRARPVPVHTAVGERKLTLACLESLLETLGGRHTKANAIQIINAFETPNLQYDVVSKQFHAIAEPSKVFGKALVSCDGECGCLFLRACAQLSIITRKSPPHPQSKVQLYANRYHLVHQRLRRNPLFRAVQWTGVPGQSGPECKARGGRGLGLHAIEQFRPPMTAHAKLSPSDTSLQLTELKALLGQTGEFHCVLGFLSQPQEGEYAIEDLSSRLTVDLGDAARTVGLFTGEQRR